MNLFDRLASTGFYAEHMLEGEHVADNQLSCCQVLFQVKYAAHTAGILVKPQTDIDRPQRHTGSP